MTVAPDSSFHNCHYEYIHVIKKAFTKLHTKQKNAITGVSPGSTQSPLVVGDAGCGRAYEMYFFEELEWNKR